LETNVIYNEDCIEGMKKLPDNSMDLVLTDPPYGVNLNYKSHNDSKENLKILIDNFLPEAIRVGKRVLITCGNGNQHLYPEPDWTLAWVISAGAGQNKWGFTCWQPILAYGKDPYRSNNMGARPDIIRSNAQSPKVNHPAPKPIEFWEQLLLRGSVNKNDIILDPFMGSGTTAIVALKHNRKFIGFEKEEKYYHIALKRIGKFDKSYYQQLPEEEKPKQKQLF